ncbi:hypothetical protein ABEU95_16090, partial [Heyndrickxia faecalis]|uniref:hypothetical protein n=1 Tax=Heyndrickxia faecalis TaxID=2824910 RepID=UPI003D21C585
LRAEYAFYKNWGLNKLRTISLLNVDILFNSVFKIIDASVLSLWFTFELGSIASNSFKESISLSDTGKRFNSKEFFIESSKGRTF